MKKHTNAKLNIVLNDIKPNNPNKPNKPKKLIKKKLKTYQPKESLEKKKVKNSHNVEPSLVDKQRFNANDVKESNSSKAKNKDIRVYKIEHHLPGKIKQVNDEIGKESQFAFPNEPTVKIDVNNRTNIRKIGEELKHTISKSHQHKKAKSLKGNKNNVKDISSDDISKHQHSLQNKNSISSHRAIKHDDSLGKKEHNRFPAS